ncbi:DUF3696 domain-containing protein [Desulfobacterales bacterium HSG2]|nr:DUF3696 domain-containing protein [Desulfobacterales bacterium HSG2]
MILNTVIMEYFKCFEKLRLPLKNLTLLSGINASGKSSILQALTLLNQTMLHNEWSQSIILNGDSLSLGTVVDVIDKSRGRHRVTIGVETDRHRYLWKAVSDDRLAYFIPFEEIQFSDLRLNVEKKCAATSHNEIIHRLVPESFEIGSSEITDKIYRLTYISSDRLPPQETYKAHTSDRYRTVGSKGEYAPWFLLKHGSREVNEKLRIPGESFKLQRQTEAYLNRFFPGSGFKIEQAASANQVILSFRTTESGEYHRPQNVGYGLTHVMPIITACLNADRGDIILIENPESNLHPAAQSNMGLFLSRVASAGIQIIAETHSDHILNGVRRAVRDKSSELTKEQVAIHFFRQREKAEAENLAQVQTLLIDSEGNLDDWPKDFFDQFDKDSEYFAGWAL